MCLIIQFFDIKLTLNRCAGIFNIAVSFPRFDVTIIPVYVENHVFPAWLKQKYDSSVRERKNGLKIDWNWVEWIMINFDRTIDRCRCTIKTDFHIVVTSSLDEDKINFPFVHRFPSRFTRFHVTAEPNDNLYSRAITSSGVHFNCNQCVRMQSSIWSAYFSVWFINHHSR